MKFITNETPVTEKPVRVFVEVDEDGDVVIRASNGTVEANIAYLISKGDYAGQMCLADSNRFKLAELGFKINEDEDGIQTY